VCCLVNGCSSSIQSSFSDLFFGPASCFFFVIHPKESAVFFSDVVPGPFASFFLLPPLFGLSIPSPGPVYERLFVFFLTQVPPFSPCPPNCVFSPALSPFFSGLLGSRVSFNWRASVYPHPLSPSFFWPFLLAPVFLFG